MTTISAGEVRILRVGIRQLGNDLVPWLQELLNTGQRVAVRAVNKDTGNLATMIQTRIESTGDGKIVGYIEALADYALWQETVPGDRIPGVGERKRSGGKPYLRPGLLEAIRPYMTG